MDAEAITNQFVAENNRFLPDELIRRTFPESFWMGLTPRGQYPDGLGYDPITINTWERTAPLVSYTQWDSLGNTGLTDGLAGGNCLPPVHKITFGVSQRTMQPYRWVAETPDFCAVNMMPAWKLEKQLGAMWDEMTKFTKLLWEYKDRHEYFNMCKYKVIIDSTTSSGCTTLEDETDFSSYSWSGKTNADVYLMTSGYLDYWKRRLVLDGVGEHAAGMSDGSPQLTLVTDDNTIESIFTANGDRRSDVRYGEPSKLLKPYGVNQPYKGWYFMDDMRGIRCNLVNDALVEVDPYLMTATVKGFKFEINPAWLTADFVVSMHWIQNVFKQLIPTPVVTPHPQWQFNPVNYTGVWKCMNIPDREVNPDSNIIYFRGQFAAASEPIHPEFGVAFLHRNCPPPTGAITTCAT
jgi:hypothetical protein